MTMKWMCQLRFEFRMIFRNPWLLALPVLFAVLNIWNIGAVEAERNLFAEAYSFHAFVQTMTLGLVMLLGILTVRRDIRRPSYEWSSVLPVSFGTKVAAKYAAGMLYFSLFTLVAASVFAWFSGQRGVEWEITREYSGYFALTYEISYMVTLALAMLLAIAIPNRVVYLIGFCGWMFGTFFMDIFLIDKAGLYPLRTFHLSQLFLMGGQPRDTWGFDVIADELLFSRLFVVSFTLLLLVAGVTVLNRIRPTKRKAAVWTVAAMAILLAVLAFVPYVRIWQERYEGYQAKLNDPTLQTIDKVSPDLETAKRFSVTSYDIRISKKKNDKLELLAKLAVTGEGLQTDRKLKMTLNRAFTVRSILVADRKAEFTRKGDQLLISFPEPEPYTAEEPLQLEIRYDGSMADYAPGFPGEGSYYAFAKGSSVFLPGYIAWYPLIGYQPVYVKESTDRSGIVLGAVFSPLESRATRFKLSAEGFEQPVYTSLPKSGGEEGAQVFEGEAKDNLTLFGGKYKEMALPDFPGRIVAAPYNVKQAKSILEQWKSLYGYFAGWVDHFEPGPWQILFLPTEGYIQYNFENRTYVMNYDYDSGYAAKMAMNQMLLGSRRGDYMVEHVNEDVRLQLRGLMWYLYFREEKGYTDQQIMEGAGDYYLLQELYSGNSENDPDQLGKRMTAQVAKALDEGKNEKVKDVMNIFYKKGLGIEDAASASSEEDKIPYSEWEREWKKVFGDEDGH